jgi:hypothetical protein
MTESYNDYVTMSSEFEVEVVADDGGFDIGESGLFGQCAKFVVSVGIKIAGRDHTP